MTRFLHTADWQLGMRARHVAAAGDSVRAARFATVERIVEAARSEGAEFILVAGDCFEDNQVSDGLVYRLLRLLAGAAPLPVLLLPGNHDCLGPTSVYRRAAMRELPPNVMLLERPVPVEVVPGTFVLPAPLTAKTGREDPTAELAGQTTPAGALRIGAAHGSLGIEGKHSENDFPIALGAARRAGVEYLALGHWHSFLSLPAERVAYAGTPEPTSFGERDSGNVALVEVAAGGAPVVRRIPVAGLSWLAWEERAGDAGALRDLIAACKARVAALERPAAALVRIVLHGSLAADAAPALRDLRSFLEAAVLYAEVDASDLRLREGGERLRLLQETHPLLQRLIAALAAPAGELASLATEAELAPVVREEALLLLEELVEETWT